MTLARNDVPFNLFGINDVLFHLDHYLMNDNQKLGIWLESKNEVINKMATVSACRELRTSQRKCN